MLIRDLAILATLTIPSLVAQSMPTYWRLADPGAKMLIGVDLKALTNSQAASIWTGQFQQAAGALPPDVMDALKGAGTAGELFKQVDRVLVSFSELPKDTATKPKMTVAVVGDFDLATLRKFLTEQGGGKSIYRGVEVWQSGQASDDVMIAIASPQVLAIGDRASVRKAVSQYAVGDASLMGRPVYQHASALAQTNDFWIAGEIPPSGLGKGAAGMPAQLFSSLQQFDLGIRMKSGLALEMNLYAASPESAASLASAMQGMAQLADSQAQNPQANEFLSRLRMGTDGDRIQMSASWTPAELTAAMNQAGDVFQARIAGAPAQKATGARGPSTSTARLLAAEPPKPRQPLKVRIYNPDGGVKELELTRD